MHSRKRKMMRLTSLAVTAELKNILMKDFSESLSSKMIKHIYCTHGLKVESLNSGGKAKVVDSIISDYKAIKPFGSVSVDQLKKDLRLAMK